MTFSLPKQLKQRVNLHGAKFESFEPQNPELVSRILLYHLIVEHYLTRFLEVASCKYMNWDGAELSFFQKVALIDGPHGPCEKNGMLPALRRLNRIRNEFAHNLNATLSKSDVEPMFQVKIGGKILVNSAKIEPIKILEMFAHFACAYFAGILYATAKEAGLPILFDGKPIGPVDK